MKYINLTEKDILVQYINHYPDKNVLPAAVINISKNKYDGLKNKDLRSLGLTHISNDVLNKFQKSPKYGELMALRYPVNPDPVKSPKNKPNK